MENQIKLLGYGVGIAGPETGAAEGPYILQKSTSPFSIKWQGVMQTSSTATQLAAVPAIAEVCTELAWQTKESAQSNKSFVVIGGDHSSAIGTWSGIATAYFPKDIGLIWIDAHLDSHTPETSVSKNIHGMPLAALLGYGDNRLTHILNALPKLKPENICILGVRSFELGEATLLKKLGVTIFWMDDIHRFGFETLFNQALKQVTQNTVTYGISIDLDALDPADAPGVTVTEPFGIKATDLLPCLKKIPAKQLPCALEIAEFNPSYDVDQRTEKLIWSLIQNCYLDKE